MGGAVGCHQMGAPRLECGVRVTAVRVRLWGSPANERQEEPLKTTKTLDEIHATVFRFLSDFNIEKRCRGNAA